MTTLEVGPPPSRLPDLGAQGLVDPCPELGVEPTPKIAEDSPPFWKVMGQTRLGAARPQLIQDDIYQYVPHYLDRPSQVPRWWQQRAQQIPMATDQVAGVALAWLEMNQHSEGGRAELHPPQVMRILLRSPFSQF